MNTNVGLHQRSPNYLIKNVGTPLPHSGAIISSSECQQLASEMHKFITKTFQTRKVYTSYRDSIWGVDFAGMQLISKYNEGSNFCSCIFKKYTLNFALKK